MTSHGQSPSRKELRIFSALWLVFFGFLGALAWRGGSPRAATALLAAAGVVGVAGIAHPPIVRAVFVIWTGLTRPIGVVVSKLLLMVVFYLVVTPMGVLQRLLGGDVMARRLERSAPSYWEARGQKIGLERYLRQY